jgi:hypothetical protein
MISATTHFESALLSVIYHPDFDIRCRSILVQPIPIREITLDRLLCLRVKRKNGVSCISAIINPRSAGTEESSARQAAIPQLCSPAHRDVC